MKNVRHDFTWWFYILVMILLIGCKVEEDSQPEKHIPVMVKLAPRQYPEFWDDMGFDGFESAIDQSLAYFQKINPDTVFLFGQDQYSCRHLVFSLTRLKELVHAKPTITILNNKIREQFQVYQSSGNEKGDVLFTGYFNFAIKGGLNRSKQYTTPVYGLPPDLLTIDLGKFSPKWKGEKIVGRLNGQTVDPYYDRKAIEEDGALEGQVEPIAWVEDPVDLFFLQIQGSGKIILDSGESLHVLYHAQNGHPYKSIGKLLIDENKIAREEMSMQRLKIYLKDHPDEIRRILNYNPSYVFFRFGDDGPFGNIGVKLTPGRSIATDYKLFPKGCPGFIEARKPLTDGDGQIKDWIPFSRFVVNQDTGGAIRGAGRADIYWGEGEYAELAAGNLKENGRLYFLVLKSDLL